MGAAVLMGVSLGASLLGCGGDLSNQIFLEDSEFLAALPSREVFQVEYVESSTTAEVEAEDDVLLLQTTLGAINSADDWLELTASITDALRDLVPAVRESNYREWGPYDYEFLDSPPIYLKVEVTRSLNGASYTYNYRYSTSASGPWIRFFVGRHFIGETIEAGDGSMEWQLGAMGGDGTVTVDYDLRDEMKLLVTLDDATFGSDGPFRARWYFQRQPDGGGDLEYYAWTDFNPSEGTEQEELMAVRTRWLADGAGRADAMLTDGDLFEDYDAALVQCWSDTGALTAQLTDPENLVPTVGDPEIDCPFRDAAAVEHLPEY